MLHAEHWPQVQTAVEPNLGTRVLGLLMDVEAQPLLPVGGQTFCLASAASGTMVGRNAR